MKDIYKKLSNLKPSQKIILAFIITFLIAIMNFFYYNYQILKLPKSERNYTLKLDELNLTGADYKDNKIYTTSNNAEIDLNLQDKYIKKIIVTYDNGENFNIVYNGQIANNYGLYNEKISNETCYNELDVCGLKINRKINGMKLQIDKENINISKIIVVNNIEFNVITFIFWTIGINLIVFIVLNKKYLSKNKHILTFVMCLSIGTIFLTCCHNMPATTLDGQIHYNNFASLIIDNDKMSVSDYYNSNVIINFYGIDTSEEKEAYTNFNDDNSDNYISSINDGSKVFRTNKITYFPIALFMNVCDSLGLSKSLSIFKNVPLLSSHR